MPNSKKNRPVYRVRWKRPYWAPGSESKAQHCERLIEADQFIDRLHERGRCSMILVEVREPGGKWRTLFHNVAEDESGRWRLSPPTLVAEAVSQL